MLVFVLGYSAVGFPLVRSGKSYVNFTAMNEFYLKTLIYIPFLG